MPMDFETVLTAEMRWAEEAALLYEFHRNAYYDPDVALALRDEGSIQQTRRLREVIVPDLPRQLVAAAELQEATAVRSVRSLHLY